jgi:hypothetical protein
MAVDMLTNIREENYRVRNYTAYCASQSTACDWGLSTDFGLQVALKIMSNKDQFDRELIVRGLASGVEDSQQVLCVLADCKLFILLSVSLAICFLRSSTWTT